jgi:DNA invertase Pin-like site-specific DNA recombinase
VLVIEKLDRLARNVYFVSGLMESRVRFVACDMPEANELTIHIMAAFAEHEAKRISQRTREALAQAKAREVTLGKSAFPNFAPVLEQRKADAEEFAEDLRCLFDGMRLRGLSRRDMVDYRMEKLAEVWRAYDVTIDGMSLVQNYRNTFNTEIQKNGIDGLIKALAGKNQELAAQSPR